MRTVVPSRPTVLSRTPYPIGIATVASKSADALSFAAWYGVFAPAGTPQDYVQRLNGDIVRIVQSPEVRELFLKQGATSYAAGPEEFAKVVQRDIAMWGKIVRESGAKPD